MILQDEINRCMEEIIDELCNFDLKFDKLTDYILNKSIEDVRYPFHV